MCSLYVYCWCCMCKLPVTITALNHDKTSLTCVPDKSSLNIQLEEQVHLREHVGDAGGQNHSGSKAVQTSERNLRSNSCYNNLRKQKLSWAFFEALKSSDEFQPILLTTTIGRHPTRRETPPSKSMETTLGTTALILTTAGARLPITSLVWLATGVPLTAGHAGQHSHHYVTGIATLRNKNKGW